MIVITRKEVALKAGVSEGTVSNVINGKFCVSKEKRERVMCVVGELNYVPDQTARNLATNRSQHIGIAIYEVTNPYHMEIAKQIEECAIKKGYIVSIFMLDNNMDVKLRAIKERRLDGLVNFMTNIYPENFIATLVARGTVLVNFNEIVGSIVNNDYRLAMKEIMIKIKELGHKKIAYLTTMDKLGFMADSRGKQWFESVEELGFQRAEVFYNDNFDRTSDATGLIITKQLLNEYPDVTAIFCTNDLTALGCIRALADAGLRVPDDISVIGCDNINLSAITYPSLTTISIDKMKQGEEIVNIIIDQIKNQNKVVKTYTAEAIFRESTAKVREN